MNISNGEDRKSKKKKRNKKRKQVENGEDSKKRVKFDLQHVQTREFFQHGKVATMKLPESNQSKSPTKAVIKTHQ